MPRNRTRVLAILVGLALLPSRASAVVVGPGHVPSAAPVEPTGFAPCGPPLATPCPAFVSPYPAYQGHVVPSPGYRVHVVPYGVNPCAVHVWDVPHPCRTPEPIAPPCSPCGGF